MKHPSALPLLFLPFVSSPPQPLSADVLVLAHVTVIDMTGAPPKPAMSVVISGNRIAAMGSGSRVRPPAGARVIDATAKFLIPGLWDIVVGTPAEARQTVDTLKRGGADCVKVYDRLPRDAYFAIVEEAKKRNLPLVGHVPLSVTSVEASEAGQVSIEHLGSILESASTLESELHRMESASTPVTDPSEFPRRIAARGARMLDTYDAEKAGRVFATLARNRTWQVPTLEFKWAQTFIDDIARQGDARLKYVPASEQQWWSPGKNFFARYRTPEYIVFRKRLFQRELELVGAMHRAGVPFMTGTDLSGAYVFAGFSLHHELELFVEAGLSPMEALQAATRNPAMFLGELSSQGTVERGKSANLVLLDANPLEDIRNTRRINGVVLNGRYLSKETLQRMLAQVEVAAGKP